MFLIWSVLLFNALVLAALWLIARVFLRGEDLSRYDHPPGEPVSTAALPAQHEAVRELIADMRRKTRAAPRGRRLAAARQLANQGFAGAPNEPDVLGVEVIACDADGVPAEWVIAPGADPERRLLYIHGGAFVLGSPSSHRAITGSLSRRAGVAVLAIDYRLMPEHHRIASVKDCRTAYRWMLRNGPRHSAPPHDVYVAGDSAGGNLTLVLLAWIRDKGVRPPEAAAVLSPATDNTYASPSLRTNIATDPLLGPGLGAMMRLPRSLLAWVTLMTTQRRPQNPVLSPLRANLSGLPPMLVQASSTEMLRDDARRYANKARAEGSVVEFEVWNGMVHVWQLFEHVLPEAGRALEQIAGFLNAHSNHEDSGAVA